MKSTELKPSEQKTIQALLIALAQLETSLPEDLQEEIHQIGNDLYDQPKLACNRIIQLVKQNSQLNHSYQKARSNLQKQYQSQERDKLEISASGTVSLQSLAMEIFTADDFQSTAQQIVKQVKTSQESFIKIFQRTVSVAQAKADLKAFSVLKALEFGPLSIENLAFALEISPEETRQIIQRLWHQGKISTTKAGIFGTILPFLRPKKRPSQINDVSTYFTLTSFGYFDLHPVIKIS